MKLEMAVKKGWGYWKHKGEEEELNGDFNKAIELYSMAIIECPSNEDAFISRGYVKCDLKEFESAIDDFTAAIEINPRNTYGFINRAYVNLTLENFEDALNDLKKCKTFFKNNNKEFFSIFNNEEINKVLRIYELNNDLKAYEKITKEIKVIEKN